jgi:predicted PurR-regulated permease PerM
MYKRTKRPKGTQFLITMAAFVILVAGMRAAEEILVPFLLSVFLAIICAPPLFWLRRKHVPTALALFK